jgi:hypothetical protein
MSRKQSPAVFVLLVVLVYLLNPASSLASSTVFAPGDGEDTPGQADVDDIALELPHKYDTYFFPIVRVQYIAADPSDGNCTHYVDNEAAMDGYGSWGMPWDNIAGHVNDLEAGDVMCVRGDPSGSGRVYIEPAISLNANTGTSRGTEDAPIVIRTYPGEHVVVRGTGRHIVEFVQVAYWEFDGFVLDKQSRDGYGVHFRWASATSSRIAVSTILPPCPTRTRTVSS